MDGWVDASNVVVSGFTTGCPIKVEVANTDQREQDYAEMALAYRPSHADATYDFKYGVRSIQVIHFLILITFHHHMCVCMFRKQFVSTGWW